MRWFVVFLLLANVALYFWVRQQNLADAPSTQLVLPDIGTLRLAGEGPADGVPAMPSTASQGSSLGATAALSSAAEDGASQASATAPAGPPGPDEVDVSAQAGQPAGDVPSPPPPPEPTPAAVDAQLTAENASPLEPDVLTAGSAGVPETRCLRVGPLTDDQAERLLKHLPDRAALLSDTSEEHSVVDGYYVMIPPLPSREAGLAKLKALSDAGIRDTWLFPSGPNRNAISLGMFRRESSARRHAENIAAKGFEAQVSSRESPVERRWLLLQMDPGSGLADFGPLPDGVDATDRDCPQPDL